MFWLFILSLRKFIITSLIINFADLFFAVIPMGFPNPSSYPNIFIVF